jgi:glucose/arabinose dehydrogenase
MAASIRIFAVTLLTTVIVACGATARLPVTTGTGPNPALPPPRTSPIPLVKVATAKGWAPGEKPVAAAGTVVSAFASGLEHPRWLYVLPNGDVLYVAVGSNSNVAEHGIEQEKDRAAVLAIDRMTGASRVFASGLRNPVGMAWEPERGALWVAVNERDELGSDLVPDYMTAVREGGFYGWPYSYFGQHVDARVKPPRPDLVAKALVPDYALGPHTASLGLAYSTGGVAGRFERGMFVGQHGSWNRQPRSGYKVIFVPFANGRPSGDPVDVLTGFLDESDGDSRGRPVGVVVDRQRALLVADDVGNVIWRVAAASGSKSSESGSE